MPDFEFMSNASSKIDIVGGPLLENSLLEVSLYEPGVSAGFPSPADDFLSTPLDLNDYLIKRPPSTFLVRASGESMEGAGIYSGDILVVDRSLPAKHEKVVIVALNGELLVKRLIFNKSGITLRSEHLSYDDITVDSLEDLMVWGVVTYVIHSV